VGTNPDVRADPDVRCPVDPLATFDLDDRVHVAGREQAIASDQAMATERQATGLVQIKVSRTVDYRSVADHEVCTSRKMNMDLTKKTSGSNRKGCVALEGSDEVPDPRSLPYGNLVVKTGEMQRSWTLLGCPIRYNDIMFPD